MKITLEDIAAAGKAIEQAPPEGLSVELLSDAAYKIAWVNSSGIAVDGMAVAMGIAVGVALARGEGKGIEI
jgi:hypothetical protein